MKRIANAVFGIMAVCAFYAFPLSIGEKAPAFTLITSNDSSVSLTQYQDQVCVFYFVCTGCPPERATGSAVEKHIWQVYKNQNVKVLGIEIAHHAKGEVVLSAQQWGITFPIAINGDQTASAYGNASNSIILVDKQGIVRAVAAFPLVSDTIDAQIDSAVKSIAGKIPALLTKATTNLATIIQKVSENCEKIKSFSAEVKVRFRICPNWYDRIGRYDYQKPDSTKLVLIDSISAADTARSAYTASWFATCSDFMIPSILNEPIMSAKTVRVWADSAAVVMRDSPDTCVVKVPNLTDTLLYTVDMARGVIIGLDVSTLFVALFTHQYFYGYDKGIYYLQKVSCSSSDTSIMEGGYRFSNIRINNEPVTSAVNRFRREKSPCTIHAIGRGSDRIAVFGGKAGMRIAAFDLLGRSLFETALQGAGDVLRLDRLCRGTGCPSGPLILRINGSDGAAFFSIVVTR